MSNENHNTISSNRQFPSSRPKGFLDMITTGKKKSLQKDQTRAYSFWVVLSYIMTFWAFPPLLSWIGGMKDITSQQAFREKISLCVVIFCICGFVAFLTFFLPSLMCPHLSGSSDTVIKFHEANSGGGLVWAYGRVYNSTQISSYFSSFSIPSSGDISTFFPIQGKCANNTSVINKKVFKNNLEAVFIAASRRLEFDWDDITLEVGQLVVLNGVVVNITNSNIGQSIEPGADATLYFVKHFTMSEIECLIMRTKVGIISKDAPACFLAKTILLLSLFAVIFVVMLRFTMAVVFDWFLSSRISPRNRKTSSYDRQKASTTRLATILPMSSSGNSGVCYSNSDILTASKSCSSFSTISKQELENIQKTRLLSLISAGIKQPKFYIPTTKITSKDNMYVLLLVTCYSEGIEAIRITLDSLAESEYPDGKKLLFIISDGIVVGSGNGISTPDILLSLMKDCICYQFPSTRNNSSNVPFSYDSIGENTRATNGALVYVGVYVNSTNPKLNLPAILIVKTGFSNSELSSSRPGNRGKRDSQMILMHFLMRVLFDDRMTELDYAIFNSIFLILGITPDVFEAVLMVDADTRIDKQALKILVNALQEDPMIMGLCGETKISNKKESWVTMIQVFEYYISHHLGKAFESVFGGVTCLPGCFCMYRIKAPKNGAWVPILASPEIGARYSENQTNTLHKKNLLLLGEDRYLSTLLLQYFPKRKLMFVPDATCHTMVPASFSILLSQRRRWINSTIHNLFELLFVRDLCGIFCCSMQFVVFMELIGTIVLPAAITFTGVLIVVAIIDPVTAALPLALLALILGLPAVLILVTTRKYVYIGWMFLYLLALPVWNFVLPLYAYWHFDDFSWGETRKIQECSNLERKDAPGDGELISQTTKPTMKRWGDWTKHLYKSCEN